MEEVMLYSCGIDLFSCISHKGFLIPPDHSSLLTYPPFLGWSDSDQISHG